jgi:hypothetical protein
MKCPSVTLVEEKSTQESWQKTLAAPSAKMQGSGAARAARVNRKNTGAQPAATRVTSHQVTTLKKFRTRSLSLSLCKPINASTSSFSTATLPDITDLILE